MIMLRTFLALPISIALCAQFKVQTCMRKSNHSHIKIFKQKALKNVQTRIVMPVTSIIIFIPLWDWAKKFSQINHFQVSIESSGNPRVRGTQFIFPHHF